jgi:hypothetical protein
MLSTEEIVDFLMYELKINKYHIFENDLREFTAKCIENPSHFFESFDEEDTVELYKALIKVHEKKLEVGRDERRLEIHKLNLNSCEDSCAGVEESKQ